MKDKVLESESYANKIAWLILIFTAHRHFIGFHWVLLPHHLCAPVSDLVQLGNSQTVLPTRAYTQTKRKISVSCWEVYSWIANFPIYWRHSFKSVSTGLSNLHRTFWRRQSRAIFSRYRHLQPTTNILTHTSHPHRFCSFQILSIIYLHHPSLTFQRLQGDGGVWKDIPSFPVLFKADTTVPMM